MPGYPTTIQLYYPNGHSRHNSGSFSFAYCPVYRSFACFRNETASESGSSHVSADVSKRCAEDDSSSENEDTEENTDDITLDSNEEEDDDCTEDTEDDETDKR